MELPVYNMAGEEVSQLELPAIIFNAKINRGLMHQALVRQMANGRRGTHKAKGRSEVRYSTAKVYRQKGTGRARHGSRRAPIYVGGGVAHGPLPRDYSKKMPRKMRRAALRSALTVKATSGDIVLVDEVRMDRPKTKEMVAMMNRLAGDQSALILLGDRDENVELSARNIPTVKTLHANYLNIRDLLGFGKLVIPLAAMEVITGFLGRAEEEEWADFEALEAEDFDTDDVEEETVASAEIEVEATDSAVEEDMAMVDDDEADDDAANEEEEEA